MSDAALYPLVLDPKLAPAIWGGDELVTKYGKHGDPNAKIGESWECWDTDTVTNGSLRGDSIATLRGSLGPQLLGDLDRERIFPVLTKIITARESLSVQVHPNDAYAQRVEHQPNGKTECWYVFSADEGSELVLGWTRDTSREEYERRVKDGTLGDILNRISVKAGDSVYIPAGMVHAIGAGVTVFETQQASDLTYRMFDWNRVGADGKPRELHVQKAADVLFYKANGAGTLQQIEYTFENLRRLALIADDHFVVERVVATEEPATMQTEQRPLILMSLDCPLHVACDGVEVALTPYQTALIPAAADGCTVRSESGEAAFMFVTPPEHREGLAVQMLAAGVEQDRIDRFMEQFSPLPV